MTTTTDITLYDWQAALLAFNTRDYRTAVQRFEKVLEAQPGHTDAREYLARTYYLRASLPLPNARRPHDSRGRPDNEQHVTLLLARVLERQSRHDEAAAVRKVLVALTGDERHGPTHQALA
ncbi:MAG: tetratricopeptide repeat protein [Micropruina glycogenica]